MRRLTKPDSKYTDFKNHKLQQYENIGLAPEEIKSLIHDGGIGIAIRSREVRAENEVLRTQLRESQTAREQAEALVTALKQIAAERPLTGPLALTDLDMQKIALAALEVKGE